jgi:hypothetical protein
MFEQLVNPVIEHGIVVEENSMYLIDASALAG